MPREERDLLPLDPELNPVRWEEMVGSIMAAARPELERRSVVRSPLLLLTDWLRPTLAASVTVAAFAGTAAIFFGDIRSEGEADVRIVAEGIGMPRSLASWLDTGRPDALDELVFGMEGEVP
ncbi:MAG: hypothetical protein WD766_14775 [Gemmatimonadota bacterium]